MIGWFSPAFRAGGIIWRTLHIEQFSHSNIEGGVQAVQKLCPDSMGVLS